MFRRDIDHCRKFVVKPGHGSLKVKRKNQEFTKIFGETSVLGFHGFNPLRGHVSERETDLKKVRTGSEKVFFNI